MALSIVKNYNLIEILKNIAIINLDYWQNFIY